MSTHFGINKNQQITRLIYEIAKRENLKLSDIKKDINKLQNKFQAIKNTL